MPDAKKEDALILYSGGKDSFLCACRAIQDYGMRAVLLSCNGGTIWGEENLSHGVARLRNRYGKDSAVFAGSASTAAIIQRLNEAWIYEPWSDLARSYPDVRNVQINCLHCQTAMWVAAVAYAEAKKIGTVLAGYKHADPFCTGIPGWASAMRGMADRRGIQAIFPLWEMPEWGEDQDAGRDEDMARRGFQPQVLEPKCLLGRPSGKPGEAEEAQILEYFRSRIEPAVQELIDRMIPIYANIRLSENSLSMLRYPDPGPDGSGIY